MKEKQDVYKVMVFLRSAAYLAIVVCAVLTFSGCHKYMNMRAMKDCLGTEVRFKRAAFERGKSIDCCW